MLCLRVFILKARYSFFLKTVLRIFKIALCLRNRCFYETATGNFERFQNLSLNKFSEDRKPFSKNWSPVFLIESTRLHWKFPNKTVQSEASVKQIEWEVLNGSTIKNGVLQVTAFFSGKFCFSIRTSFKDLPWCTHHPNVLIHTFLRCCSCWCPKIYLCSSLFATNHK